MPPEPNNDLRRGFQTSEFWITVVKQILALLVFSGVVAVSDQSRLEGALTTAVTALGALVTSAAVVAQYIRSRYQLKKGDTTGPRAAFALLAVMLLPIAVSAQGPPARPTCWFSRPQQTDPALIQLLQQIVNQQQQILALLQQQRPAAPAAPAAPPIIVLGGPYQQIPLGGPPRQEIPLGGPPREEIPLGGPPKQEVPLGGPPRQEVPLGPAPRQQIPLGEPKPTISYQRYTLWR
jgi:hypothetical protein